MLRQFAKLVLEIPDKGSNPLPSATYERKKMSKQTDIKKIAQAVRLELESIVGKPDINAQPHLGGLCGHGSVMLHEALTDAGYKSKIARGYGHWFVICDGLLCDITASQFGQGKVVVRDYEKVRQSILTGQYQMQWWRYDISYETACDAGLCGLKKTIRDAKEQQKKKECTVCGDQT